MVKTLVITDKKCDMLSVLQDCGDITCMGFGEAIGADLNRFDSFCVLASGNIVDARLRDGLEKESRKGKRVFLEVAGSFFNIYSVPAQDTVKSRFIYVENDNFPKIEGLCEGDLLDDQSNLSMQPYFLTDDVTPVLVYKEHIIAHIHLNATHKEILDSCKMGMWFMGENVLMTSFRLANFNKARFAPRGSWQKVIAFIVNWLTGREPKEFPESVVHYGFEKGKITDSNFDKRRKAAVDCAVQWLNGFLVDNGSGGIKEGLRHNINPDGEQTVSCDIRADCCGSASGVFKFYSALEGEQEYLQKALNIDSFVYGAFTVKGGLLDGILRWSDSAWGVCYQDDVARAVLPELYNALFLKDESRVSDICRILDFLVRTTARDGLREYRTDGWTLTQEKIDALKNAESATPSAHYNAYYHAALLLAYKLQSDKKEYLEIAQDGLEKLMRLYPDTQREQSETEEMCRMVLPLAVLYDVTGDEKHKAMLYRVVEDLQKVRHSFGGYAEWDTDYKAVCSRESTGECSILTENGDAVADLLYSCNWLPVGFAYAYFATRDIKFYDLWKDIVIFFINCQILSDNPLLNGSWCRAFDMQLREAYAAPHDSGWATYAAETGWTATEIALGMMLPDILKKD